MKGSTTTLIFVLIFIGILALLSSSLLTLSASNQAINVTSTNETVLVGGGSTDFTTVPSNICQLSGSENSFIDLLQSFINVIPGINCITGFMAFAFSYSGIQTGYVYLGLILSVMGLVLVYIALGLLRGGK